MSDPFLIYYGEDFYLDAVVRDWGHRGVVVLSGDGLTDRELVRHIQSPAVDCPVTVVDDAERLSGDKALLKFIDERALGEPLVLVAVVRDQKLTGAWIKAAKKGKVVEFKRPSAGGSGELTSWVMAEGKKLGLGVSHSVSERLIAVSGKDLRVLHKELDKLRLYIRGRDPQTVTTADVDAVATPHLESELWDLCDSVLRKDRRKSLQEFMGLYKKDGDSCLVPLLYALMKQSERLLIANQLLGEGAAADDIAHALSMNPWRFKNYFLPYVKNHTGEVVREGMQLLCELDLSLKTSTASKRIQTELAICYLTN